MISIIEAKDGKNGFPVEIRNNENFYYIESLEEFIDFINNSGSQSLAMIAKDYIRGIDANKERENRYPKKHQQYKQREKGQRSLRPTHIRG